MNYTSLHSHSHFSTLDGLNTPEEYMRRVNELGMTHFAVTDHGTLSGHRAVQRAAKAAGVIPILGNEMYFSETDRFDRRSKTKRQDGTNVYTHLTVLAKNANGLSNLNWLSEQAWTTGYYNKPRIDIDLLQERPGDLVVLSGCMGGAIAKAVIAGNMDYAFRLAHKFDNIFPGNFYIEIMADNDKSLNDGLLLIADNLGIPAVLTSDCHYANKKDLWVEEAMLILSTNPKIDYSFDFDKSRKMDFLERYNYIYPNRTMTFEQIEIYLRSVDEHLEKLAKQGLQDRTDLFTNSLEIAGQIGEYPYHEALDLLPRPKNAHPDDILEAKAREGLESRGFANNQEYVARLEEELRIIKDKDFSTYFLIVSDAVNWAKDQGILVGPGRGSAAGSLICYCLGVTQLDPVYYGLLFMRFIDPSRSDYPDIDEDYQKSRRGEVKDYLRRKFTHVASIATFAEFKDKSVVRDASRVFQIPKAEVNKALKGIDAPPTMDFLELFKESQQGKDFIKKYPEVMKLASELSGRNRSMGMHASGLVIAKDALSNYGPIETAKDPNDKDGPRIPVLAMDMDEAADIGLIKLDFLGLKALDILADTLQSIKKIHGRDIDLYNIELEDKNVFAMISEGWTKGIFQAEGHTFTKWIIDNGVYQFSDLAIGTSIARPGPMNTIGEIFKRRRKGKEKVTYVHEIMREYTEETLGVIVYQEQVMQALTELGGMTMVEANAVRRIIGKKKDVSELEPFRDKFIDGASKHVSKAVAQKLWKDFEAHTGYSFNKSHAFAYSLITYWTAWFKYHYPKEFMCAVLANEGDKDSRTDYLIEAKRLGIKVLLPHVNESEFNFSVEDEGIRFGLYDIKYVSNGATKLIANRPYGSYAELRDKVEEKGSGLTRRVLDSLNAIGAAAFKDNPRTGNERDNLYEYLQIPAFETKEVPPVVKNQIRQLEDYTDNECFVVLAVVRNIKRGNGWSLIDMLDESGSASAFHVEHTPIGKGQMYAMLIADNSIVRYAPLDEITKDSDSTFVRFLFDKEYPDLTDNFMRVVAFTSRTTKAGKKMASVVLCDEDKQMIKAMVFPQNYVKCYSKCREGQAIVPVFATTDDGSLYIKDIE